MRSKCLFFFLLAGQKPVCIISGVHGMYLFMCFYSLFKAFFFSFPIGFLPNYLLPEYEEVVNRPPTPPPPYSALQTGPSSVASSPLAPEQQQGHCTAIQPSPVPPVSDSLCCRPTIEEPQPPTLDLRPKPDTKSVQTAQNSGVILLSEGLSREGLANQEKLSESGDDSCKNPLLKDLSLSDGSVEDKERLPSGRRRRITGDSGIEVCVCGTRGSSGCSGAGSTGQESKELRELESLLGHEKADEEEEEAGEFCDSCSHQASFCVEEEQALGEVDRRPGCGPTGSPQPAHQISSGSLNPPLCLLLHTINEQEGPAHSTSTEPQG